MREHMLVYYVKFRVEYFYLQRNIIYIIQKVLVTMYIFIFCFKILSEETGTIRVDLNGIIINFGDLLRIEEILVG